MVSVNDGAVMAEWAKAQNTNGTMVRLLADTECQLTQALGAELNVPPLGGKGVTRCQRIALLVEDGVVKAAHRAFAKGDLAGDNCPEVTMPDQLLEDAAALQLANRTKKVQKKLVMGGAKKVQKTLKK